VIGSFGCVSFRAYLVKTTANDKKISAMDNNVSIPLLFLFDPSEFWNQIHQIVKEEVTKAQCQKPQTLASIFLPVW
jgi:hypothetical protein